MQHTQLKNFESKLDEKKKQHKIEILEQIKKSKQIRIDRMKDILFKESNEV